MLALATLAVSAVLGTGVRAHASCNVVPPAIQPFRSTVGSIDRPFAGPGDFVELAGDGCGQPLGFPESAGEYDVTVLFTPPGAAPRAAVVLTTEDCDASEVQTRLAACRDSLGTGAIVSCRQAVTTGTIVDLDKPEPRPRSLRVRFPDTDDLVGAVANGGTNGGTNAMSTQSRNVVFSPK